VYKYNQTSYSNQPQDASDQSKLLEPPAFKYNINTDQKEVKSPTDTIMQASPEEHQKSN
jgi:hypothetical protein